VEDAPTRHLAAYQRRAAIPVVIATFAVIPALVLEESSHVEAKFAGHVINWASWLVLAGHVGALLGIAGPARGLRIAWLDLALVVTTAPFIPIPLDAARLIRLARVCIGDGIWWAIVTATTVGYGDISPVTTEGRIIAVVLMLLGIGVIGAFTATVASFFVSQDEGSEIRALEARLDRLEGKIDRLLAADAARGGDSTPPGRPDATSPGT
jgi:voltage-gated potassium channel Kch